MAKVSWAFVEHILRVMQKVFPFSVFPFNQNNIFYYVSLLLHTAYYFRATLTV